MDTTSAETTELQLALLRRSNDEFASTCERCARCQRTPLAGEHVYECGAGRLLCELCVSLESEPPRASRLVHGPEYGQTIRIVDQRAA